MFSVGMEYVNSMQEIICYIINISNFMAVTLIIEQ